MALIECKNVSLGYEHHVVATGINFTAESGDFLCIVGENGSGKSTLVKAILGLKETYSGHLHLGDGLKKKQIGYLPQQTTAQRDFPASVAEVVLSGCLPSKTGVFYSRALRKRAEDNMEKLDILRLDSLGADSLVKVILNGRGNMNPYVGRLTPSEALGLVNYMRTLAEKSAPESAKEAE